MLIQVMLNSEPKNKISKTFESAGEFEIILKGANNILQPVIIITQPANSINFNYIFIPKIKRYYFIDKITALNNKQTELKLTLDVLKSYETDIKNGYGVVIETDTGNPYINGYTKNFDVRTEQQKIDFQNNFNSDGEIIMTTVAGG